MKSVWILVGSVALLGISWCLWAANIQGIATHWVPDVSWDIQKAGTWGDSFGAFNALVSAFGFAAVLATLWQQGISIKDQAADQHRQRFDASFFELVRLLNDARDKVKFCYSQALLEENKSREKKLSLQPNHSSSLYGVDALIRARSELAQWAVVIEEKEGRQILITEFAEIFKKHLFDRYPGRFGSYYRLVYSILNRIDEDKILSDNEKIDYSKLLRAQFTSDEILLLACNGSTKMSGDFSLLITKYRMLKYSNLKRARNVFEEFYTPEAFAARD